MEVVLVASIAVSVLTFGALTLIGDPQRRRASQMIAATSWWTAGSRDGAAVKITGIVVARSRAAAQPAPALGGAHCVAYRVEARVRSLRGTTAAVRDVSRVEPFEILRPNGERVTVEASHALLAFRAERLHQDSSFARRRQLLCDLGFDLANAARSELDETAVELGTTVTVAGTLAPQLEHPRRELGYRDGVQQVVRLVGDRAHPIAIGPAA